MRNRHTQSRVRSRAGRLRATTARRARAPSASRRVLILGVVALLWASTVPLGPGMASVGIPGGSPALEMTGNPLHRRAMPLPSPGVTGDLPWLHAVPGSPTGLLETPDGSYFPLRGVDVNGFIQYGPDWNESIPLHESDMVEMHDLGLTFIRLSISWSLLEPSPGVFNQSYLSELSQAVDWAGAEGIYVLVDMHQDLYNRFLAPNGTEQDGFPTWAAFAGNASRTCPVYLNQTTCLEDPAVDNAWNAFWNNTTVPGFVGLQQAYEQAWQMLAGTFANSSTVAGYDLMNEPATGTVTSSLGSGFCPNGTWEWEYQWEDCYLLPLYQTLIHAIRQVDTRHAIFFEPSVYTDALNWAPWNPVALGDPNVVYEPHVYTNVFGPTANWSGNDSALISAYQNAQYNAQEFGGTAWFVGEYGTNPDHWHDGWVEANVNLANQFDVGTSFWEWKDGITVPTMTEPGGSWGVVNVNGTLRNSTNRAAILASPHPVGAGDGAQVRSADFNFTTATYDLTVSNSAPGGWAEIYLPSLWYPSGVQVNGTYTGISYRNSTYTLPGRTLLDVSLLNVSCTCTGNYTVHATRPLEGEGWLAGDVSPSSANLTAAGRAVTLNHGNFTLALPPGNVSLTATAPRYATQTQNVTVRVGSITEVAIDLALLPPPPTQYPLIFSEAGLPVGTNWSVAVGSATHSSTASTVSFTEVNGTYHYSVVAVSGYASAPSSGNATVNGAAKAVSVTFSKSSPPRAGKYAVTFTETGLPSGTSWPVTLNGSTVRPTTTTITFAESNGTYSFTVGSVSGYTSSPSSGSVKVNGEPANQSVTFSKSKRTTGFLGLPSYDGYILIVVIVVVVAVIAGVMLMRKRAPPKRASTSPKEPGEDKAPERAEGKEDPS